MDKVVQSNVAGAEESASASEEMRAQAEQLKFLVKGLASLAGDLIKELDLEPQSDTESDQPERPGLLERFNTLRKRLAPRLPLFRRNPVQAETEDAVEDSI